MRKKVVSLLFLGFGIFLLIQVILPIIAFKFWEFTTYNQNKTLISPDLNQQVSGVSIKNVDDFPALISDNKREQTPPYSEFYLSIPSINLEKAKVVVDDNNFDQNLGHLPGSPLPGEKGNAFISGHSSFPEFYRPGNYKAIFAHLPEIKKGAEIIVEAGGQVFRYQVMGLKTVDPKEVGVINPPDQVGRYLTLMTCVPPGFTFKRLIVLAQLEM